MINSVLRRLTDFFLFIYTYSAAAEFLGRVRGCSPLGSPVYKFMTSVHRMISMYIVVTLNDDRSGTSCASPVLCLEEARDLGCLRYAP